MGRFNRAVAKFFGYDLMRYAKSFRFDATLDRLLNNFAFDGVVDVGANSGGFSRRCLKAMPQAPVYAFEPAGDLAARLTQEASAYPNWTVARAALGDAPGEAQLNISNTKSVYNSLHAANPDFAKDIDGLQFDRSEAVEVTTLDLYAAQHGLDKLSAILLKVDTQGHDFKVLKGAAETLKRVKAVVVELPFQNIYDSGDSYQDILGFMAEAGFVIYSLSPISCDARGALVEADAFFVRA